MSSLLEVEELSITLPLASGELNAVSDVSFNVKKGKTLGIVGESGSGKSLSSLAVIGLLPRAAQVKAKKMCFDETDLLTVSEGEKSKLRGNKIAMIFQEPMTSLNPVYTIGQQMVRIYRQHRKASNAEAVNRAVYLLQKVGISSARSRLDQYPHQLSGGLRQRVMIAMMLMCKPEIIIADEPTTALDVTVQAQILCLLRDLQAELGMAMIIITHDLGIVARVADHVAVMYAGQIIERGDARSLFNDPIHPYTQGLLKSIPIPGQIEPGEKLGSIPGIVPSLTQKITGCRFAARCEHATAECSQSDLSLRPGSDGHDYRCILKPEESRQFYMSENAQPSESPSKGVYGSNVDTKSAPMLSANSVECIFQIKPGLFKKTKPLYAVNDISLELRKGDVVALVGESGCGKSTLAKIMLGLQKPTGGTVLLDGESIIDMDAKRRARLVQPIFQDPYSSLNPRKTIGEIIKRPLVLHHFDDPSGYQKMVTDMMERVGLPSRLYHNYPNQLSGGQRQRVAIARALIIKPEIVVCDEPTSALDVSVQAQILNLLLELREEFNLTYLMITHDMAVVEHIATRVAVMYLGKIVEMSSARDLFSNPRHPYTNALLESVLTPDSDLEIPEISLNTNYPNPIKPPSGCKYHPRCKYAMANCKTDEPLSLKSDIGLVRCHLYKEGESALVNFQKKSI